MVVSDMFISNEKDITVLFPTGGRKYFSFSSLSMMLAIGFVDFLCQVEEGPLYSYFQILSWMSLELYQIFIFKLFGANLFHHVLVFL